MAGIVSHIAADVSRPESEISVLLRRASDKVRGYEDLRLGLGFTPQRPCGGVTAVEVDRLHCEARMPFERHPSPLHIPQRPFDYLLLTVDFSGNASKTRPTTSFKYG